MSFYDTANLWPDDSTGGHSGNDGAQRQRVRVGTLRPNMRIPMETKPTMTANPWPEAKRRLEYLGASNMSHTQAAADIRAALAEIKRLEEENAQLKTKLGGIR